MAFRNDNSHDIYVSDGSKLRRIRPGRGVEALGEFAKNLKATNGVSEVKGDDAKAALDVNTTPAATDPTIEGTLGARAAETLAEASRVIVSAPLQVVVGDDQAPFGPPTGVKSTKQQEAAKGEAERRAFAEGEPLKRVEPLEPAPETGTSSADAHNAQADARDAVEEFAEQLAQVGSSDDDE